MKTAETKSTKTPKAAPKDPTMGIPWGRGAQPAKANKAKAKKPSKAKPAFDPMKPALVHFIHPDFPTENRCGRPTATRHGRSSTWAEVTCGHCKMYGEETLGTVAAKIRKTSEAAADAAKDRALIERMNAHPGFLELQATTSGKVSEILPVEDDWTDGIRKELDAIMKAKDAVAAEKHAEKALKKAELHAQVLELAKKAKRTRKGKSEEAPTPPADVPTQPAPKRGNAATLKRIGERDRRLPPVGTVITKERNGQTIKVKCLEAGFEYNDQTFSSLSAVANHIAGGSNNGFLFFGLIKRGGKAA